ncbi:MAG: 50S ribosomal protein L24 [Myxococcales bacterium]|nr:50S ribosomal protein L24 [Myxococcales bacterium]
MALRIRKGDDVVVIAGKDKGSRGKVLKVVTDVDRVIVEGVNKVKRHQRPTPQNSQGGIIEKEMPIDMSNVMIVDPKTEKPTRIRMGQNADGKKIRIAVRSGAALDS